MNWFKEVFGRIWALWAMLLFTLTMLVFLIPVALFCMTIGEPRRTDRFIRYSRIWMGVFLPGIGCPLFVKGKEHFKKGQPYIVICNHNALMDVPISSPAIPGGNKTIAKAEMAKVPVFGIIYKLGGGRTSGMNLEGMVGKLAGGGLDRDGDGDVDFQDLAGMFTGGSNAGDNSGGMAGGNALDALKGIFGR